MTGFGKKFEVEKNKKGENINISNDKIIKQAFLLHSQGNIRDAEKYYRSCIKKKINDYRIFSNYGLILKNLGRLKEAEKFGFEFSLISQLPKNL